MSKDKPYRCVNCGKPAAALYKHYGPSVLKLTKCIFCGGITDKYVEYDAVIVMIDLVLISKEAQRHIIYNTDFKPYWKLLVILMLLETYGVWSSDSLLTVGVNAICNRQHDSTVTETSSVENATLLSDGWLGGVAAAAAAMTSAVDAVTSSTPASWRGRCWAWRRPDKADENDLFIWEKDFYIQFIGTFFGIAAFLLCTFICSKLKLLAAQNKVSISTQVKAFSLANMSSLFTIPMLVWGSETRQDTRAFHYWLVWAYSFVVFYNVFTVVYESRPLQTVLVLILGCCAKFQTTFHIIPLLRHTVA